VTHILFVTDTRHDPDSAANRVSAHLLERLHAHRSEVGFTIRDLACHPLPFANDDIVRGMEPGSKLSVPGKSVANGYLDRLLEEIRQSDAIVISVSMKDFKIPLHFKTWADALCHAAASSGANGTDPRGILSEKHVYLVVDRTKSADAAQNVTADFRFPYLQSALKMMGAAGLRVVDLKGTVSCEEEAKKTIAAGIRNALKLADQPYGRAVA
jgi:FMN-dependent NADH-azoreductase